jgi:hypothetical protein
VKHSLSFEIIVQSCDLTKEALKLMKKAAIEGLTPSSTFGAQVKPTHHPFPPPKKSPCFLVPDTVPVEIDRSP